MRYLRQVLGGGALVALLLSSTASPAHAAGEIATRLSISPLETLTVGTEASLVVTLAQEDGVAVVDEPIVLTIDGDSRPRRWTDTAGVATFNLPRDLLPGEHEVVATYAGRTNRYLGVTARTVVDIVPYELAIETVPPLPGMVFEIDGTRFEAGTDGIARVGLERLGDHTVTALPSAYRHPGERVEFSRWSNETFGPTINIRAPLEVSLQAGFDLSYQASLAFMDPHGNRVDEDRIEEVTLRNSIGTEIRLRDGRSRWFKAVRTIRRPAGLDTVPIRYTVEDVVVDGANVVNVGQQRFDVEPDDAWPIELLLYSVRMVPNDALFGFPLGEAVILTHPSGSTERIEAVDGVFAANGLARGLYRVQLADAPGWSPVTPVALSRDQEVRVRVITYVDIGVVVILGLGLALGLLHIGRPHLAPAAMAGAKGVVSVTRNPRSIGALLARRRAAASPASEMAPAVATAREFVLPPLRAERSSAVQNEPYLASQSQPTPARGAVPIAQVIRTTLGSPLPANLAEASALPPPAPSPTTQQPVVLAPTPLSLAPSMAVAETPTPAAGETAPPVAAPVAAPVALPVAAPVAMATREAALPSAPSASRQRKPRRARASEEATTPKQPSRRASRKKDASSGLPATAEEVSTQKRRRSPKKSPDASSVAESGKRPRPKKPPRPKAPTKRSSATSKAVVTQQKPRRATASDRSRAAGTVVSNAVEVKPSAAAMNGERAATAVAAKRPSRARSVTPGATAKRTAKARPANKAMSPPNVTANPESIGVFDLVVVDETTLPAMPPQPTSSPFGAAVEPAAKPSKARSATKAAAAKPSKARTATKATTAKRSKARSATKAAAAKPSRARPAAKAASPQDVTANPEPTGVFDLQVVRDVTPLATPSQPTSSPFVATVESAGKRAVKARPPEEAASPPDLTAKGEPPGVFDLLSVRDTTPDSTGPQLTSSPFGASAETTDVVVTPAGPVEASEPNVDDVSTVPTAATDVTEVRGIASVASLLPRLRMRPDRPTSARPADTECTGCGADLKPGARFCRRCGRATAIAEREREGMV